MGTCVSSFFKIDSGFKVRISQLLLLFILVRVIQLNGGAILNRWSSSLILMLTTKKYCVLQSCPPVMIPLQMGENAPPDVILRVK